MAQTATRQPDASPTADTEPQSHPLDELVPDPSGLAPSCDEETFAEILESMVADEAPRLFAIVEEYGERVDGFIAAWGMAFEDRAEVVSVQGGLRMSTRSAESALFGFGHGTRLTPRVVWVNPDAATPTDDLADDDTSE